MNRKMEENVNQIRVDVVELPVGQEKAEGIVPVTSPLSTDALPHNTWETDDGGNIVNLTHVTPGNNTYENDSDSNASELFSSGPAGEMGELAYGGMGGEEMAEGLPDVIRIAAQGTSGGGPIVVSAGGGGAGGEGHGHATTHSLAIDELCAMPPHVSTVKVTAGGGLEDDEEMVNLSPHMTPMNPTEERVRSATQMSSLYEPVSVQSPGGGGGGDDVSQINVFSVKEALRMTTTGGNGNESEASSSSSDDGGMINIGQTVGGGGLGMFQDTQL